MKKLIAFFKEEDGAALIEYVLLAAIIAVGCIVAMGGVRDEANGTLDAASDAMANPDTIINAGAGV